MIRPEALKIVDREWYNSIVEYDTNDLVFRFFVRDKKDEEDKLKEDILNNVFVMDHMPLHYDITPILLKSNYNNCKFANPIRPRSVYCDSIIGGKISSVSVYRPVRMLWDIRSGGIYEKFKNVFLRYFIRKMYLELSWKDFSYLLYQIKHFSKNQFIRDYKINYDNLVRIVTPWFNEYAVYTGSESNVEKMIKFFEDNIFDPSYFNDVKSVIYKHILKGKTYE